MEMNDQINGLKTKRDAIVTDIDALKARQAGIRSDNGRLRRTYNSLVENDITYSDPDTGKDVKLSDVIHGIITAKEMDDDDLQKDIVTLTADIKKYNKAIDTLEALMPAENAA